MATFKPILAVAIGLVLALPARADDKPPEVRFVTWTEPVEHAFPIAVPQNWSVRGGVSRRSPVDVRSAVSVSAPGGNIRLFLGDTDIDPRRVPDAATQMAGLREGQVVPLPGGRTLISRYVSGVSFARQYIGWKLCRQNAAHYL